jgi:glycosyltransferase involved in cell wall biosynthesis
MIAPTPFFSDRGCHVRIFEEASFLGSRGLDVLILTYHLGNDPPGLNLRRLRGNARYDRAEPGPDWRRLYLDAQVLIQARKAVRDFQPDLVHAHLHEGALIGLLLRARLPLIFDYQGSLTRESLDHGFIREGSLMQRAFAAVEQWVEKGADRVIVSSGPLAQPLKRKGIAAAVVPDWVDVHRFEPGPAEPRLREKLGLGEEPVAVCLGVLSDYQGTDIILKAAAILSAAAEPVRFLIMGYPEASYRERAEKEGLGDRVIFTGRLNYFEAQRYLRLGSLALAPKLARSEGNGKVLLYMACGLPVAAFDLPVNREIMGDLAQWVEIAADREECARRLAQAVTRLTRDKARAAQLGAEGRRRVEKEFSVEAAGGKLLDVYADALGHRP